MTERHPAPCPATTDRPRGALTALCMAVTTSWGLLYYSLPVALTQATMALGTLTLYTVTISLIPILLERGVPYATAAPTLGLVGAGQVLGRLGYSALHRTTTPQVRTVAILGAGALGLGGLALVPGPYWLLIALDVITGATRGCLTLLQTTAVSDRWGTQHYGSVNAAFTTPMTAVGALAPIAGPILAGPLGSYSAMTPLIALAGDRPHPSQEWTGEG
ncbi:hypothetical protein [Citricoccus sp. SGAir0253]|uniref:hypothetical protein n=1 Tax=Citricoccus sp. SGAir0253 TaxID=2567881 RepID=UPI001FEDD299|nr:hypothetical protein [Citricoccus sp. SGAir0253]